MDDEVISPSVGSNNPVGRIGRTASFDKNLLSEDMYSTSSARN
jgi:hypothetical protein